MASTVKITSPDGIGQGTHILIDGEPVKKLTGVEVSIGVGQPNTVRLHMIALALAQDIEIEAEVKIGGAVMPPAVELALLAYLVKKYPAKPEARSPKPEARSPKPEDSCPASKPRHAELGVRDRSPS